jgi:hypothetical protein
MTDPNQYERLRAVEIARDKKKEELEKEIARMEGQVHQHKNDKNMVAHRQGKKTLKYLKDELYRLEREGD